MDWLSKVVGDPRTERVIMALILINAVTLGLEISESVMARYGTLLVVFDRIIIAIFVIEILARFMVQRSAFFRDGWNLFDVVVVGIALAPATSAFSVLRALRVLRLLRLITAVPALQRVVGGLIGALPGMGSILLLIALVFYVSAVMAANLYGKEFPELFGTLGASLYTLFTIMTLEGWTNDVVNPIMAKHPYAWLFFIPFIVVTTFWVLNLFIGIIVNAMQEEHARAEAEIVHDETAPLVREIAALKAEITALRREVSGGKRPAPRPGAHRSPKANWQGTRRRPCSLEGRGRGQGDNPCAIFAVTCKSGRTGLKIRSILRWRNSRNMSSNSS